MKRKIGRLSFWDEKLASLRIVIYLTVLLYAILIAGQLGCFGLPGFTDVFGDRNKKPPEGVMTVTAIDVGQGESILVRYGDYSILIDGGENGMGDTVLEYLEANGVTKLDWVIGTHPHSDHIGGLDTVIRGTDVDNVMLTRHSDENTPSTKTYNDLLTAIMEKGLTVTTAVTGQSYGFGEMTMTVLSSGEMYEDYNRSSIVLFFDFGDTDFLTCGDVDTKVENDLADKYGDLSAALLKVSHHGGNQSTGERFLSAVRPKMALICVGAENEYGHPSDEVLGRLSDAGTEYRRTDIEGDITVACDGVNLNILE